MLYVEQSLGPNEELVHVGEFHWMYTVKAFLAIVWGTLSAIVVIIGSVYIYTRLGKFPSGLNPFEAVRYLHPGIRIFAFVMFMIGIFSFAQMMVIRATTEIAITNTRLIFKRGLVARQVGEMSIDRIEGVNVLQPILGRIFDYGRLAVRGMGVGEVILPSIADPLAFRRAIEQARST